MNQKSNIRVFILFFIVFLTTFQTTFSQKAYFQQQVNYNIDVTLDDSLQILNGQIEINYINRSPDTLTFIYFHLWPNAYSTEETAYGKQNSTFFNSKFYFSTQEQKGYIRNLNFIVDSIAAIFKYDDKNPDIGQLLLPQPLLPGDSVLINTPFTVKIPYAFSRMGHVNESYYITQWYPKPAVYDCKGWHVMPYLDLGEFYSEFGNFDVRITLPESYYVASTGVLLTESEINRIEKRVEETKSGLNIDSLAKIETNQRKTIHYYQENIHDFAWFADKSYLIDKSYVKLPSTENFVITYTYYHQKSKKQWSKAIDYVNNAIWFYSDQIGYYPYQHCTAVEGLPGVGGGMEYPMITLIGPGGDDKTIERTIIHEVAHNWFYGILAFNEREHSWLDEGFTSFYENEYMKWRYPYSNFLSSLTDLSSDKTPNIFGMKNLPAHYMQYLAVQYLQSRNIDQSMSLPSELMNPINYYILSYYKPVLMINQFKELIGHYTFKELMNDFFNDWKFKHPYPEDVKNSFESETNKDLSWFFDKTINDNKITDYKIKSVKKNKEDKTKCMIVIKNKTNVESPVSISVIDKHKNLISETWFDGFSDKKAFTLNIPDSAYSIKLNNAFKTTELNLMDNGSRISGVFKKVTFPKRHFLYNFSNPAYAPVFYTPVIGWNMYNRWMIGLAVYSDPVILRNFDYVINPFYSAFTNSLVGSADIGYIFRPRNTLFSTIRFGVSAKQYDYAYTTVEKNWTKIAPEMNIDFKPSNGKNYHQQIRLRTVFVNQGVYIINPVYDFTGSPNGSYQTIHNMDYWVANITHSIHRYHKINPWNSEIDIQYNDDFLKTSVNFSGEHYYRKKSTIDYRFFAGKMFEKRNRFIPNPLFRADGISSSYIGGTDYMFDEVLLGRSEFDGLLSHQMIIHDGGFKMATPLGMSKGMIAANVSAAIPKIPIIRVFLDVATFENAKLILQNNAVFIYEAGFEFQFIKNTFEVFVPILISKDLKRVSELNGQKWSDRIRFVLNLNAINPFKYKKTIHNIAI